LTLIDFAQSNIGKVLGWLTSAIETTLRLLLGKLHLDILNVGHWADEFVDLMSRGSSLAIDKLRDIIRVLPKVPALNFPTLAERGAEVFVNVYGTKDILYQTGIAGFRDNLSGFTKEGTAGVNGQLTGQLINIEIIGAEHLYYMKRNDLEDPVWNQRISDFVTNLMIASQDKDDLIRFLNNSPYVSPDDGSGIRVVRLTGWETHV